MIRILSLIGLIAGSVVITMEAAARTADDYFCHAADPYTAGRFDSARSRVELGLQQYPSDPKLQALLKKIEEQQQEGEKEGEKEEEKEQQQPEGKQQQGQEQEQEQQQEQEQEQEQGQEQQQEQLGLEEAERILDALKAREVDAQKRRRVRLSEERYTENEW